MPGLRYRRRTIGKFALRLLALAVPLWAVVQPATLIAQEQAPASWLQEWPNTDFSRSSIAFSQILSGGPPRDGIPSIDEPVFAPLSDVTDIADVEPVIGVAIGGEAKAYPLRVLTWHEIVNDTIGDIPVAVTYCPLCNAAIVFDRRINGEATTFGTTGKLRHSDLVMYDRTSESWWQQFSGEAIVGRHLGAKLAIVPARLESFAAFRERHPNGRVLIPDNPAFRPYGRNPYPQYDSAAQPFLFNGKLPEGIEPMARVVVITSNGVRKAIALSLLRDKGSMTLGDVTLNWKPGQASALDTNAIANGRDVGNVIATGRSAAGEDVDVHYDVTFAFVFHAFHPEGEILTQ